MLHVCHRRLLRASIRRLTFVVLGSAVLHAWLGAVSCCAQDKPKPGAAKGAAAAKSPMPAAAAAGPAQAATGADLPAEVKPELLYVRDKDGNLVPVLGFT